MPHSYTQDVIDYLTAKPGEFVDGLSLARVGGAYAWPGEFVDGLSLARVGGAYAWRTRVSEARHRLMAEGRGDIANVQIKLADGQVQSLYSFVPAKPCEYQQVSLW